MGTLDKRFKPQEKSEISHLVKILENDPQNVEILKQLAEVFERQRDYQAAINQYRRLIEIDPTNKGRYEVRIRLNEDFLIKGAEQLERL